MGSATAGVAADGKITSGTTTVIFYLDKQEAFINGQMVTLDTPAMAKGGRSFLPAKFLGDAFGIKVEWDGDTRQIFMDAPKHDIVFQLNERKVFVNGYEYPFDEVATIVNGRLMIKLTWLSEYMGASYTYNAETRRVDVMYVKFPEGIYNPEENNSRPVAKFAFSKPSYQIGEPVKITNLSYDPDAEGLTYAWEGKEEVYFEAGTYTVTLVATDRQGARSFPFSQDIVIENKTYLSKQEYEVYMTPVSGYIKTNWSMLYAHYLNLPELEKTVTEDRSRALILSDSPETFYESGILYEDTLTGLGRLYASHVNGTEQKMGFAILATNTSDEWVTIRTTNKGEVYPSIYAHLIGSEASVDFLMRNPMDELISIPPGKTFIYRQFPDFYPGQGVNLIYDVETDGEVKFTFATDEAVSTTMLNLPKLPYSGHIRGTFPITAFDWEVKLSQTQLTAPRKLTLGDGKSDPFQKGYDPLRESEVDDPANYGTIYRIHAEKPRKMAIMLLARGGGFKGPFKINGELRKYPTSGVLTAFDGMVVLAKTTGKEETLEIEFSPPSGSAFPIDIIFYPLDERAQ